MHGVSTDLYCRQRGNVSPEKGGHGEFPSPGGASLAYLNGKEVDREKLSSVFGNDLPGRKFLARAKPERCSLH